MVMDRLELLEYYEGLLDSALSEGFAWAVAVPLEGGPGTGELVARLRRWEHPRAAELLEPYEPEGLPSGESDFFPLDSVHYGRMGEATVFTQGNGARVLDDDVLAELSRGVRLCGTWWSINSSNDLVYAEDGQVLLRMNMWDYWVGGTGGRRGGRPHVLDEGLTLVAEAQRLGHTSWKAAALAIVELRTGVHLELDWVLRPQPLVLMTPEWYDGRPDEVLPDWFRKTLG
ncbi:hypothetical protein [Bailinhaonella thermotolerans]|uniref:Uncharacterized protein n=1 Tax=Bailinhaonella thermotolerans TaxID=1070861 RepID=A0A3A4A5H3_9ACTN|nr:hypothetical protein [Bailinhaonella thermotolerans]RJL23059.1 hypothetical protein D5H75_34375 [Bailinhaonella thermotolerans]